MPYTADISRANPSCFPFLIIECMGMGHDMPGHPGRTKRVSNKPIPFTKNRLRVASIHS